MTTPKSVPIRLGLPVHWTEKALYRWGLLPARQLVLPDFLGIGAQKAGTTWLHRNLSHHPQVFLPTEKELHYFDWNYHRSLKSYSAEFASGRDLLKGDITPNYGTLSRRRIALVRKIMPNLKFIFLMRDPIDRAWSQAMMNLVTKTGRAVADVPDCEFIQHFEAVRSIRRGDYLATLDRWQEYFPESHFFVGFFESIAERPRELLTDLFQFFGVSTEVDWSHFPYAEVIHAGAGIKLPDRFRSVLAERYRNDIERLYDRFGTPVERWRVP